MTQPPAKTVRDFFTRHPRACITHHWRRQELSPAYREALDAPRYARTIKPKAIVFETSLGVSELSLANVTKAEIDGDLLHLSLNGQDTQITYQALVS